MANERETMNRPTTALRATKTATVRMARTIASGAIRPKDASEVTTPRMVHPVMSSIIATANIVWPRSRRIRPRSRKTLASTGIAVMDSAAARKRANTS